MKNRQAVSDGQQILLSFMEKDVGACATSYHIVRESVPNATANRVETTLNSWF